MNGLFRRGGMWWARLVVPERMRAQAGRREFVQSTGTHEHSVGKMVAAVLLAGWRKQLFEWERGKLKSEKLLQLVEGGPVLSAGGYVTLKDAAELTGLGCLILLRAVTTNRLDLYCQLDATVVGHVLPLHSLDPIDPLQGYSGGVIVPDAAHMPNDAHAAQFTRQPLRVSGSKDVAIEVLAGGLEAVDLVLLDAPSPAGWVFAPSKLLHVAVNDLVLLTGEVEALRLALVARVPLERIEHARSERRAEREVEELRVKTEIQAVARTAEVMRLGSVVGKWASKLFSEAVNGYCQSPDGLPGCLASEIDQRQRKAGLMLFAEFMGDLPLSEIDGDVLRAFRDGPLKTIPGRVNTLPKTIKRDTMKATIEALAADGRDWPLLSGDMQHERMQWLTRLFAWMHLKGYLSVNPAASLRGETGLTKAERIAAKQADDDEDEGNREPFTAQQLKTIFSQMHFAMGHGAHVKLPSIWYGFEYWLPLLGLYCGLRIKEVSQLHLTDVRLSDDVWVLDINRRTRDKSLKNEQAQRIIPLHPELIRLGFLSYCDCLRDKNFYRVFPELTYSKSNAKYGKEPGRKMSAMLKNLGMPRDGTLVFHCLRHNANNALARVSASVVPGADENLKKFIRYRIMGHEVGDDVNARHYTATTAAEMALLMSGVEFDLPSIASFDIAFAVTQISMALKKKEGDRHGREDMGPLNAEYAPPKRL